MSVKLATSIPVEESGKQPPAPLSAPWLVRVSQDGTIWTVADRRGRRGLLTRSINFNLSFPDGSMLTDPKNSHYYQMAREYAWIYRLYEPDVSARRHISRVNGLLTFFYWLKLHNVRSLTSVTRDHIDLYAEKIAFGKEWAIDAPQRLHKYLVAALDQNPKFFPNSAGRCRVNRHAIYVDAGVAMFSPVPGGMHWYRICSRLLDWVDANSGGVAELPSLEQIMGGAGTKLHPLSTFNISNALLPLEELWIWRSQLPSDNLRFTPFLDGASRRGVELGVETKRYPTIPPRLAIGYLSRSLTWVLEYAPILIEDIVDGTSSDVSALNTRLKAAGLDVEVTGFANSYVSKRRVSLIRIVEVLSAACFTVIASLTARRLEEILDLGEGCVVKDLDGQYWLKIYIEKTSQRYDQVPIPVAVAKAIQVMERVSETARDISGDDSIWQIQQDNTRVIRPEKYLNDLAFLSSDLSWNHEGWRFSAHQFRRFFAILYFWRFEKGDLAGLSHHLRHFDLEMTKRYVTDVEFGKVWKVVDAEWQGEFIMGVIDGSRDVGGIAGERLKKEAKKLLRMFRKTVDVMAPERALERLQRLATRWGSEFRQHAWGTVCACPANTKFSELARCKGAEKSGPVYENAGELTCSTCPFAIHTERFVGETVKSLEARTATTSLGENTILHELANLQVLTLESVLATRKAIPMLSGETDE